MGNVLKKIGLNNLIEKLKQAEDQNINLQIALAAVATYFGRIPNKLSWELDEVLKTAQADRKATLKSLLDAVVAKTVAFKEAETATDAPATEADMAPAGQLTRQQVLEGAAGQVVSVTREVI